MRGILVTAATLTLAATSAAPAEAQSRFYARQRLNVSGSARTPPVKQPTKVTCSRTPTYDNVHNQLVTLNTSRGARSIAEAVALCEAAMTKTPSAYPYLLCEWDGYSSSSSFVTSYGTSTPVRYVGQDTRPRALFECRAE